MDFGYYSIRAGVKRCEKENAAVSTHSRQNRVECSSVTIICHLINGVHPLREGNTHLHCIDAAYRHENPVGTEIPTGPE